MRYATKAEAWPYLRYHRDVLLENVHGLVGVTLEEDEEGAFALFRVQDVLDDPRTMSVEQAAGSMTWPRPEPEIRVRVKVRLVS